MTPTDAYSSGHLVLSHLVFVLMLRPFFPELVMSTDLLSFEHPSVLLFCFMLLLFFLNVLRLFPDWALISSLLLENRASNVHLPGGPVWCSSRCFCPACKPQLHSFSFNCSPARFLWSTSFPSSFRCPCQSYSTVVACILSQIMPNPSPPSHFH